MALLLQVDLSTTEPLALKRTPIELSVNFLPPVALWFVVKIDQTLEIGVKALSRKEWVVLGFSHLHDFSDIFKAFSWHQFFEFFLFFWIGIILKPNFSISEILIQLDLVTKTLNQTLELGIFELSYFAWAHQFLFPFLDAFISFLFQGFVKEVFELFFGFIGSLLRDFSGFNSVAVFIFSWIADPGRAFADELTGSDWGWVALFQLNFNFTVKSTKGILLWFGLFIHLFSLSESIIVLNSFELGSIVGPWGSDCSLKRSSGQVVAEIGDFSFGIICPKVVQADVGCWFCVWVVERCEVDA